MRAVNFPDWPSALTDDGSLNDQQRAGFEITIRWFLGFCKRGHEGATIEQGHLFLAEAMASKQPNEWMHRQWRDALNWFFLTAKRLRAPEVEGPRAEARGECGEKGVSLRGPEQSTAQLERSEPEWKLRFIKGVRIRHFAYNTEKTYLNWLERFAQFSKTNDLESLPESVLSDYLDHMAVVEEVSAGTQRQALNCKRPNSPRKKRSILLK